VRAVGVEEAAAVRAPLFDEFLRGDRPLSDLLLGYLNPPKNTPSIAAGLDGDEFGIAGVSPTINLCYSQHSSLKLKFGGSGRKSAG
jgi:hypothetical protein